jgi:hypothetical protein
VRRRRSILSYVKTHSDPKNNQNRPTIVPSSFWAFWSCWRRRRPPPRDGTSEVAFSVKLCVFPWQRLPLRDLGPRRHRFVTRVSPWWWAATGSVVSPNSDDYDRVRSQYDKCQGGTRYKPHRAVACSTSNKATPDDSDRCDGQTNVRKNGSWGTVCRYEIGSYDIRSEREWAGRRRLEPRSIDGAVRLDRCQFQRTGT